MLTFFCRVRKVWHERWIKRWALRTKMMNISVLCLMTSPPLPPLPDTPHPSLYRPVSGPPSPHPRIAARQGSRPTLPRSLRPPPRPRLPTYMPTRPRSRRRKPQAKPRSEPLPCATRYATPFFQCLLSHRWRVFFVFVGIFTNALHLSRPEERPT